MYVNKIARPLIFGLGFLHEYKIGVQWSSTGERIWTHNKHILEVAIETISSVPKISTRSKVNLPTRTLSILNAKIDQNKIENEHQNLVYVSVLHKTGSNTTTNILFMAINMSTEEVHLKKGEILGFLEQTGINSNDLITKTVYETVLQNKSLTFDAGGNLLNQNKTDKQERRFITSQADIETHCREDVRDLIVDETSKQKFKELCTEC